MRKRNESMDIRSQSPDGRREAVLEYAGEIRFGPPYYYLRLLGAAILKRLFGSSLMWSPDSRFLLVQEWLSTSERDGPRTQIVVFDFLDGRECSLAKADQGFVEPLGLEGKTLR